jgi:hypothetical protein
MPLLIFVAAETGVCVPLPSKLTSASAAIPAFRPCLPSRSLAMDYSVTSSFDSELKLLFPFLFFFYSTFVIKYPNCQSYMLKDSVNIEKHIKTYLLNTCVLNVNPENQVSPMTFPCIPPQSYIRRASCGLCCPQPFHKTVIYLSSPKFHSGKKKKPKILIFLSN